ncbi:hypothetical protein [Sulfobacillus sp. hq2]|uniref:hypothetical protein n=1 Tax=Sulfobacillus sp. hq2 TaxID=2039167 RepID=UPI001304ED93|nr:hypothetical protein [Sulfobacillus sp. hq2]
MTQAHPTTSSNSSRDADHDLVIKSGETTHCIEISDTIGEKGSSHKMTEDLKTLYKTFENNKSNNNYVYYLGCSPEAKKYLFNKKKSRGSALYKFPLDNKTYVTYQIPQCKKIDNGCAYLIQITFQEKLHEENPSEEENL